METEDIFEYCPDGSSHIFKQEEKWNEEYWDTYRACLKCEHKISIHVIGGGCRYDREKKHKWNEGDMFYSDEYKSVMKTRECRKCKDRQTTLIDNNYSRE